MKINKCQLCLEIYRFVMWPVTPADITDEYVNGPNYPEVNRHLIAMRQMAQTRRPVEPLKHNYEPFKASPRKHSIRDESVDEGQSLNDQSEYVIL